MSIRTLNFHAHFIFRTAMYISPVSKETICAFITGHEIDKQESFSRKISQRLSDTYHIEYSALGWPGQVTEYSNRIKKNWISAFKQISLEIIISELNEDERDDFFATYKDSVQNSVNRLGFYSGKIEPDWLNDWLGIVNCEAVRFKAIWNSKQFEILVQFNAEVLRICSSVKSGYSLTEKLINLKRLFEISETYSSNKK